MPEDVGYFHFQFVTVNILYHVAVCLRQARVVPVAVVSRKDNDGQRGIFPLDILEEPESLRSVQMQIQEDNIGSEE